MSELRKKYGQRLLHLGSCSMRCTDYFEQAPSAGAVDVVHSPQLKRASIGDRVWRSHPCAHACLLAGLWGVCNRRVSQRPVLRQAKPELRTVQQPSVHQHLHGDEQLQLLHYKRQRCASADIVVNSFLLQHRSWPSLSLPGCREVTRPHMVCSACGFCLVGRTEILPSVYEPHRCPAWV